MFCKTVHTFCFVWLVRDLSNKGEILRMISKETIHVTSLRFCPSRWNLLNSLEKLRSCIATHMCSKKGKYQQCTTIHELYSFFLCTHHPISVI